MSNKEKNGLIKKLLQVELDRSVALKELNKLNVKRRNLGATLAKMMLQGKKKRLEDFTCEFDNKLFNISVSGHYRDYRAHVTQSSMDDVLHIK